MLSKRIVGTISKRAIPLALAGVCVTLPACGGPSSTFSLLPHPASPAEAPRFPTPLEAATDQGRRAADLRLGAVGARLQAAMPLPDPVAFRVLQASEVNAYTRDGIVYVTLGMLRFAENDDELALVVAHELGHVVTESRGSGGSRQDRERLADQQGILGLHRAGYDLLAACRLLERLAMAPPQPRLRETTSHPTYAERLARAQALGNALLKQGSAHTPPHRPTGTPPVGADLHAR